MTNNQIIDAAKVIAGVTLNPKNRDQYLTDLIDVFNDATIAYASAKSVSRILKTSLLRSAVWLTQAALNHPQNNQQEILAAMKLLKQGHHAAADLYLTE